MIESGGRLGDAALDFIGRLSYPTRSSPSVRAAFATHALLQNCARTFKGTAVLILARPSSRNAPGGVPVRGSLQQAAPMLRGPSRPFHRQVGPFSHSTCLGKQLLIGPWRPFHANGPLTSNSRLCHEHGSLTNTRTTTKFASFLNPFFSV